METKRYRTIDRQAMGWPAGPWDDEDDKVQWQDEATGFPCLAVRNPRMGHWCGYVGVSAGHPAFGMRYELFDGEVHGGLSYADFCQPEATEGQGICHVPSPGEDERIYWLGFHCAHGFDLLPRLAKFGDVLPEDTYRTLDYVQRECVRLAQWLRNLNKKENES